MDIKTTIFNKIFNMNKRKLGITIIVLLVVILILFPFIDTNFFYSNRIKNRIYYLNNDFKDFNKLLDNEVNKEYELFNEEKLDTLMDDCIKYIENDVEALNYIKERLPECYICNLDGKVIVENV